MPMIFRLRYTRAIYIVNMQRGTCIKGLIWPPLEPKTENFFSQISFDWFIRRMTEVLNFEIYLNHTVAMLTKFADKIGIK